jgi:hypothetical protein
MVTKFQSLHVGDRFKCIDHPSSDRIFVKMNTYKHEGYKVNTALLINGVVETCDMASGHCSGPVFLELSQNVELIREKVECKECGHVEELVWDFHTNQQLTKNKLCFNCDFWNEKVSKANDPRSVRVLTENGEVDHYFIVKDEPLSESRFAGHGGREFTIKFNDGRIVKTRNLWCQGSVSKHFVDRLPVNAEFIRG